MRELAVIEVENIFYTYRDGTEALRGLSLYVEKGERVALLGPNGAGKSTLLLHLNGISLPQKGRVSILGREVDSKSEKWVRSRVGLVFQDPDDQVFSSTVWDDVAFGPKNMGLDRDEVSRRVKESLEAVGMTGFEQKPPYHLSYGQKKRVAIAGVLAMMPEIIVLDEPMAFLDPKGKDTLLDILNRMHHHGQTIIIATHDVDFAVEWADRVIILKDGATLAQGGRELLRNQRLVEEARLRLPVVSRLFKRISRFRSGPLPLTISEAADIINSIVEGQAELSKLEKGLTVMCKDTAGAAEGYTIWLEPEHLHYHSGIVQARAIWGPIMKREEGAVANGWQAYALAPDGSVLDADIAGTGEDFYKVAFFAGKEGIYDLVLENEAGIYSGVRHIQRARLPVPVGHHVHGPVKNLGNEGLDLFCEEYNSEYRLGDTISIMVMYNGKPLPGAQLAATYHLYDGEQFPWRGTAGGDGRVLFTFSGKGHWLFACTHADETLKREGQYHQTVFTSTFVVAGVR
ncbi:MAG: ATP-binding cassette domain-containing protein [Bacillota bacterium]